jgi:predicted phosphoribosyltransferase
MVGLALAAAPPCVVLGLDPGGVSVGDEVAMGLGLAQDASRLDHPLETSQERVLGLAFPDTYL